MSVKIKVEGGGRTGGRVRGEKEEAWKKMADERVGCDDVCDVTGHRSMWPRQ